MADFSVILQDPAIRQLTQENVLERAFHDALYPRLLFRGEASPQVWPGNLGDTMLFTGAGLIQPDMKPLQPGVDPVVTTYSAEQWSATVQQYAQTIDTHMPTSAVAIANLFYRNAQQLGLAAGQTLNRNVRNRMYNAALSGHTVSDGAQAAVTTLRVKRLNGFTRARRPDLAAGSPVRFDTVSASNPLAVTITITGPSDVSRTITGFTADTAGDETGPGTLTITGGAVTVDDRGAVLASDRTFLHRVGGGTTVDAVGAGDVLTLAAIRTAVAHFWEQNVPAMADGKFHCHLGPTSQAQVFADAEWQRLLTSLPDYYMYREFAIGELLGCVYFRNSECPLPDTVRGAGAVFPTVFSANDPFAGEMKTAASVTVHRPMFVAQGAIYEYYLDPAMLMTEAGVTGRVGETTVTNNGIEVYTDRIQLILRAPLNRLQDSVAASYKFLGDWPVRTDAAVGDASRYKRLLTIEHGA